MKKLLRNSALIGVFYYFLVLVNACCNCDMPKNIFYTIEQINARHVEFKFEADTAYTYSQVIKDSFQKEIYGLELHNETRELTIRFSGNLSLINTAYACKCEGNNPIQKDTLKTLKIITLKPYDATHIIGSDVSEYFKFIEEQSQPRKLVKTDIMDFISALNSGIISVYRNVLFMDKMPDKDNNQMQFALETTYKNGKILKDTTSVITLY